MTPDEYLKKNGVVTPDETAAKSAFMVSQPLQKSPDDYAKSAMLAKSLGLPTAVVDPQYQPLSLRLMQKRNEMILKGSPKLASWLLDNENYRIAADSVDELSWWETAFGATVNAGKRGALRAGPQAFDQYMANASSQIAQDQRRSFGEILWDAREPMIGADGKEVARELVGPTALASAGYRWLNSRTTPAGPDAMEAGAAQWQQAAGLVAKRIAEIPMSPGGEAGKKRFIEASQADGWQAQLSALGQAFREEPGNMISFLAQTAVESAPSIAVASGVGLATKSPAAAAAVMGGTSFASEYGSTPVEFFQEKGIDVSTPEGAWAVISNPDLMKEAEQRGITRGVIIGALDGLSGGLAGVRLAKSEAGNMVLQMLTQATLGSGGEAGGQFASGQNFNLAEVVLEGLAEFVSAPVEVGGMAVSRLREAQVTAADAEARKSLFSELSGQAVASKLRARMPDRFREFVARATANGPVENVFVPADQFVQYFQGQGIDPAALVDELDGVSREDLDAALAAGGDLRIPTATYAAKMAGSEHDAFLMENMRFDPMDMTAREAADFNARADDIMQEMWAEAEDIRQEDERWRAVESKIHDQVVSEMRAAGLSTERAMAEVQPIVAFYRTRAARLGLATEEYLAKHPLPKIEGAIPQGMQFKNVDDLNRVLAEARNRRAPAADTRQSLLEFIDGYGGISDPGGELKARDAASIKRGKGKKTLNLLRDTGGAGQGALFAPSPDGKRFGADDVAQAAIEAGFMADLPVVQEYKAAMRDGGKVPDITRALWDAIDAELRGTKQASEQDAAPVDTSHLDDIEAYLNGLGVDLSNTDEEIRAAIEKDQAAPERMYAQSGKNTGQRDLPVQFNDNAELAPVVIGGQRGLTMAEATAAWKGFKGEKVALASGEPVALNRANKAIHSWMHGGMNRSDLIPHLPEIVSAAVSYASAPDTSQPGHNFVNAVAHIVMDGKDMAVRLVLHDVGDGTLRQYQIEGFDVTATPQTISGQKTSESGGGAAATPMTVTEAVASFKSELRLFQNNQTLHGMIQFGSDGQSMIRLFETANLSTLQHEFGHLFLTMIQRDAADGDQGSVADLETVKSWWRTNAADVAADGNRAVPEAKITAEDVQRAIDTGSTGDLMKDAAVDVGMQEQWARGYEAYLMEGKAPSVELQGVFAKMRAWMISVYKSLRGLNVNITPEIRAVFDRMLATDEEIAKAQHATGDGGGVFSTAEQMGLTPEEFDRFKKLRVQAEDEAKARLQREIMEPIRQQATKEYKAEKANVEAEVTRQVNAMPVFRAKEWLGNRRWLGDGQPAAMPDMRMSKDILIDRYGEGVLKTLPRGMQAVYSVEGGMDPDDVAGWFGFDSGDQMIKAMERAPDRKQAIKDETARVMNERHNDPLTDGEIERRALEAVHSDRKGEWIAAELKAVAEVAGVAVKLTMKDARASARQTVARMKVRDATAANRYLAAERKAAQEAARLGAMLAREGVWMQNARRRVAVKAKAALRDAGMVEAVPGQIDKANASTGNYNETVAKLIDAKRRQLMNHALFMEARAVAEEVGKAERFVQKLNKAAMREKIAGAGRRDNAQVDYLGAIDEILDRYDFRKLSDRAEQRRGALLAFVEAMKEAGRENELVIPEAVLRDAGMKPYKTLTVEELRGAVDSLKNLQHVALRWNDLIDAKNQRKLDEAVAEVAEAIGQNLPKRPPGRVKSAGEGARHAVRQFLDLVLNATTILREIDGFKDVGAAYRNIKAPIDQAMDRLTIRKEKAAADMEALYSVYSKEDRRRMAVREHIPALGYALSKWERIAVALNAGNEGNLQRLTDPKVRGSLTEPQVKAVLATLDERDANFVQSVWDYVGSFRDDIAARERRATGVEPQWVEASPVDIAGKTLKGGYYPLKYDPRLSSLARDDEAQSIADNLQAGKFGKAQTKRGHLEARAKSSGRDVELDMSVLHRHVNQVIYDLELSEPVSNSWKVLKSAQVQSALRDAGRTADFDALETWLLDVGTGQIAAGDWISRNSRRFKSNFTAAKLAFNLGTVAMQITGLSQTMVVVGKRDFAVGVSQYLGRGGPFGGMAAEIAAKSPFMSERATTFNKDISDFYNDPSLGPTASRWGDIKRDVIGPAAFWLMTKVQFLAVDLPTWLAGYHQGLRMFGGDEAKAVAHADDIVKRAQSSGLFSDRSSIERGSLSRTSRQNDTVRLLFTTLASYMYAKANVAYERAAKGARVIRQEGVSVRSAQEAASVALDMAFLFTFEAVVTAAIKGRLPDDEDDEDEGWAAFLAKETAFSVLGTIPFIRDAVSVGQGFDGGGAYGGITAEAAKPFVEIMQGKIDKGLVKSIISGTGLFTGAPSTQINRLVDAGWRQAEGEDVSPLEYLLGRTGK